jgi:hypothetical protein
MQVIMHFNTISKDGSRNDYTSAPLGLDRARSIVDDQFKAAQKSGFPVRTINMNVAPTEAGLGDVRPLSSGPVSFGIGFEGYEGDSYYTLIEPVVEPFDYSRVGFNKRSAS